MSLMADSTEPGEGATEADGEETARMTHEVRNVPVRGRPYERGSTTMTHEVRGLPTRGGGDEIAPSSTASSSRGGAPAMSRNRRRDRTPRRTTGETEDEFVFVTVEEEDEEGQEEPPEGVWAEYNPDRHEDGFETEDEEHEDEARIEDNQSYVEEELARRGYLDEDTPPFREEMEEDFWDLTDTALIRHHFPMIRFRSFQWTSRGLEMFALRL